MSYSVQYNADRTKVMRYGGPWYDVDIESGLPVGPIEGGYFKIEKSKAKAKAKTGWLIIHYMRLPKRRWWPRPVSHGWSVLTPEADGTVSTDQVVWTALYLLKRLPGVSEEVNKWVGTYPPQNVQEVGSK